MSSGVPPLPFEVDAGFASTKPDAVLAHLERVIASSAFATSERKRRFLRHVVEETLAGRAERIKAYSIATSVFERDAISGSQGGRNDAYRDAASRYDTPVYR